MSPFQTLSRRIEGTLIEKKSKFIAVVSPVNTRADAFRFLNQEHLSDANHNCWGFYLSPYEFQGSDDGEPNGSAGMPIINALKHSEMQGLAAIVSRYFGGVKLGVGGLIRAYGGVVSQTIRDKGEKIDLLIRGEIKVQVPFEFINSCYSIAEELGYTLEEFYPEDQEGEIDQFHCIFKNIPLDEITYIKERIKNDTFQKARIT